AGRLPPALAFALPRPSPARAFTVLSPFSVVLGPLVVQGLTLRRLLARLSFTAEGDLDLEVSRARVEIMNAALDTLDGDESPAAAAVRAGYLAARDVARNRDAPQGASAHDRLRLPAI